MKREEKNKTTKEKIMNAAVIEFGTKGYEKTSLTYLCKNYNIAKGLIFYYYSSKDQLYLSCIEACFQKLVSLLKNEGKQYRSVEEEIHDYLECRKKFFEQTPYYNIIFFEATLQPPKHLVNDIKKIRNEFDMLNIEKFRRILEHVELRDSVSSQNALHYFVVFYEMFNSYILSRAKEEVDIHAFITDYNLKLTNIVNFILYGLAKQNDNELFKDKRELNL